MIALALASSIGLHWTLLQVVAWTGMVVTYSQDAPLKDAVVKTFDGNHPCKLCTQIAQGKKTEKKTEFPVKDQKLSFCNLRQAYIFAAPSQFRLLPALDEFAEVLIHAPPSPPPRLT